MHIMQSATLSRPVEIEGRGIFSGQLCLVSIVPRYDQTGLLYISGGESIEAVPGNFLEQPNCTVLAQGQASVAVTEHLQAALWAAGVDSAEIHVSGPEIPNHDGGAATLYNIIAGVPREPLEQPRPLFRLSAVLEVRDGPNSYIRLSPADNLHIDYSFGHPELGEQRYLADVDRASAVSEILPARTFITEQEAQQAREAGFLKNEHEEDALVIRDGVPSSPYLFANEFARHKVLDLIGDLYVLPFDWTASVEAYRSGHRLNRELARRMWQLFRDSRA